jgi:hypothetical protein
MMKSGLLFICYACICQLIPGNSLGRNTSFSEQPDVCRSDGFFDSDTGTFDYYVNKEKVGTSYYEFLVEHVLTNTFELATEGISYKGKLRIVFRGISDWKTVYYENNGRSVSITNSGPDIVISARGREQSIPNQSQGILLEDMTPYLVQLLIRDHAKRTPEVQRFNAYFIPAMNIEGEIEYLGSSERTIGMRSGMYHAYRVTLPGIYVMEVLTDSENNICLIEYRAQNGAFVKRGFEQLLE